MALIDVNDTAAALQHEWNSRVLGRIGPACIKVLRMNELPLEEEVHDAAEALLVLDGRLELDVAGAAVPVGPGELYVIPAGTPHAVRPGSHGTLLIVELEPEPELDLRRPVAAG
ncbi:cupin domain-containing protein [Streptomyces sp. URMC 124]|uniref:cupin domain-containing protein n=1 Tax=Streptomyces sp. URMC 124 TaxID=3423405 RepID=UPI003F1E000E